MAKPASYWAKKEMKAIDAELETFTQYGFSPELQPIVDILVKASKDMKEVYYKYLQEERGTGPVESRFKCSMSKKKESLSKVAESIDGAVFTLKSCNVEVHEDSYEDGEGAFVNSWDLNEYAGMRFNSLQEVIDLIANRGIYNKDYTKPENWMAFEYDDKDGTLRLDTDVLVDVNTHPADDSDIEKWKKGEVELYNAHYYVYVRCEYTAVVPKDAIERETEELGYDTSYLE